MGRGRVGVASWEAWLYSPVANATAKATPNHTPTRAVVRGPRRSLVKESVRGIRASMRAATPVRRALAHPKPSSSRGDEAAVAPCPGEVAPRRGEPGLRGAHRDGLGILGEVDVAQHDRPTRGVAVCGQRRGGQPAGVGAAHRHPREHSGLAGMGRHQHPPPAVQGRAEHRTGASVGLLRHLAQQGRLDLRGVHADLHHRPAGEAVGLTMTVDQPLPEGLPVLAHDEPAPGGGADLLGSAGRGQVAGQGQHAAAGLEGLGSGVEGVEQRRGSELRGTGVARHARQPGLRLPGDRRLGHDEHAAGHGRTLAKSRVARSEPFTEPDTFDRVPSARGW